MSTDWTTGRIALLLTTYIKENNIVKHRIQEYLPMYNRFTPIISQDYTPINGAGPGEWNAGILKKIPSYRFTISTYANEGKLEGNEIASTARLLRAIMLSRNSFDIVVMEYKDTWVSIGYSDLTSYKLGYEKYDKCYVRSMDVTFNVEQMPIAIFDCIAYRFDPSYKMSDTVLAQLGSSIGDGTLQELDIVTQSEKTTLENLFKWE